MKIKRYRPLCFTENEEYEVNTKAEFMQCPIGIHLRSMHDFCGFHFEVILGFGVLYAKFSFGERFPVVVIKKQEDVETMNKWFNTPKHKMITEEESKDVAMKIYHEIVDEQHCG